MNEITTTFATRPTGERAGVSLSSDAVGELFSSSYLSTHFWPEETDVPWMQFVVPMKRFLDVSPRRQELSSHALGLISRR